MALRVDDYEVVEGLLYTREHEWVRLEGDDRAVVGVTDYAAKLLHDVVYVSLPEVGREVKQMEAFGSLESIKAVADIYSPLSGVVVEVNRELEDRPELVNESPYGEGWIMVLKPSSLEAERGNLLTAEAYAEYIQGLKK